MSPMARYRSMCLTPLCTPYRGAASATWFGDAANSGSFRVTLKAFLGSLCGVALINLWSRGNVTGKVDANVEVYIPLATLQSHFPAPSTDGFVGSSSDAESAVALASRKK